MNENQKGTISIGYIIGIAIGISIGGSLVFLEYASDWSLILILIIIVISLTSFLFALPNLESEYHG